mmetsp:Transcript_57559/g.106340  ORF Transcript_57559/g.106340 Transcript_57559/m.106340 type:complete len:654 (-) Transcript_57559:55-2016(-)
MDSTHGEFEEVLWGQVQLPRRRSNLLSGVVAVPEGKAVAAEFLLYDASTCKVILCRHVAGAPERTRAKILRPQEDKALVAPRLLLLSSRIRYFATLVQVQAGSATVALWKLASEPEGLQGADYSLAVELDMAGISSARSLAWMDAEVPAWVSRVDEVLSSATSAVLGILLASEVLVLSVTAAGRNGVPHVRVVGRLRIEFRATCLCWSTDGHQLMVGGQGQLQCFTWKTGEEAPRSQHFLCAGDCVQLAPLYTNSFLCCLEQKDVPNAPQVSNLTLPDGSSLLLPAGGPRSMVVEVSSNPQDAQPEVLGLQATGFSGLLDSSSATSAALQVVPTRRYVLPLKTEAAATGGLSRLRCGPELEVDGELMSVCTTSARQGQTGTAFVATGTFDRPGIKVWTLAAPHRWARTDARPWTAVTVEGLGSMAALEGNERQLRLCGLAVMPHNSDCTAVRLHTLLTERDEGPALFGAASVPRTLRHRSLQLPAQTQAVDPAAQLDYQRVPATAPVLSAQSMQLKQLMPLQWPSSPSSSSQAKQLAPLQWPSSPSTGQADVGGSLYTFRPLKPMSTEAKAGSSERVGQQDSLLEERVRELTAEIKGLRTDLSEALSRLADAAERVALQGPALKDASKARRREEGCCCWSGLRGKRNPRTAAS